MLYAGYWWALVCVLGALAWLAVLALPNASWRWTVIHRTARLALRLMGTTLAVTGQDKLPTGGCVLAVNHASYLDGLVLAAALPGQPSFVAKKSWLRSFVAGHFLGRLGTLYVERGEAEVGLEDTEKVLEAARAGKQIVFFPEGTPCAHAWPFAVLPGRLSDRYQIRPTLGASGYARHALDPTRRPMVSPPRIHHPGHRAAP